MLVKERKQNFIVLNEKKQFIGILKNTGDSFKSIKKAFNFFIDQFFHRGESSLGQHFGKLERSIFQELSSKLWDLCNGFDSIEQSNSIFPSDIKIDITNNNYEAFIDLYTELGKVTFTLIPEARCNNFLAGAQEIRDEIFPNRDFYKKYNRKCLKEKCEYIN